MKNGESNKSAIDIEDMDINPDYVNIDPLKRAYHDSIIESPDHLKAVKAKNTALMVIDMQYLDAAEGFGVFANPDSSGVPVEAQEYYFRTLREMVIPNVQLLQRTFRNHGLEIIHTRIQSLTKDGRDRSAGHKRLGLHAPPGSKEAEFLEEIAPIGDEIIINKTASGVFSSTNVNYILNNLGIEALVVTGVYTNECVSSTVRNACDLGYLVTLAQDACTTVTRTLQENTLTVLKDRYARVMTSREIAGEIEQATTRR